MGRFNFLPEFEKELGRLVKKYKSLHIDLSEFQKVLSVQPEGIGRNFSVLYRSKSIIIVKARLACAALRSRDIRVVYAYHHDRFEFLYIEIYFKGDKENENFARIREYIKSFPEN